MNQPVKMRLEMPDVSEKTVTKDELKAAVDALRSFIERIERLNAEKAAIADDIKLVFAEAKSRGYDTKAIRRLIGLRKRNPDDIAEENAVLELYLEALGMAA